MHGNCKPPDFDDHKYVLCGNGPQNKDAAALEKAGGVAGLAKQLNSDLNTGLTEEEVLRSREKYGANVFPGKPRECILLLMLVGPAFVILAPILPKNFSNVVVCERSSKFLGGALGCCASKYMLFLHAHVCCMQVCILSILQVCFTKFEESIQICYSSLHFATVFAPGHYPLQPLE